MPTPPGPKRVQFFFVCEDSGWSEELWLPSSFSDTSAIQAALATVNIRLTLLGKNGYLVYIRASDIFVQGDSQISAFPPFFGQGQWAQNCADPDLALTVRMQGTGSDIARRTFYLRGFGDDNTTLGNFWNPQPQFRTIFNQWISTLQAQGFGLWTRVANPPQFQIGAAVQSPTNGLITVTYLGAAAFNYPGSINVIGTKRMPALRGLHPLFEKPAGQSVSFRSNRVLGVYNGTGFLTQPSFAFVTLGSAQVIRVGRRKSGRPFGSPVGRRSVQGLTPV
jgi:hypothetical protein